MNDKKYIKNCLNFIGSKDRILDLIINNLPKNCNNAIDLFGGSGSVCVNLPYNNIFYNEKNIYLFNLIKTLKEVDYKHILEIITNEIDYFDLGKFNKQAFLNFRKEFNNLGYKFLDSEEEKIRHISNIQLLTLIYHSFNYMMVFNKEGKFSVPNGYGRSYFNPSLQKKLEIFSRAIKKSNIKLYNKDYREFLDMYISSMNNDLSDTFVFVDPPYFISDDSYSRTSSTKWTIQEEVDLYDYLNLINKYGGKFMLTNQIQKGENRNEFLEFFSSDFKVINTNQTFVNCSYQHKRKNDIEIMVINY